MRRTPHNYAELFIKSLAETEPGDLDAFTRSFVELLAREHALNRFAEIVRMVGTLLASATGDALSVTTASPLSVSDIESLSQAARAQGFGAVRMRVDAAIEGGAVVQAGDRRIDASVRGALTRLFGALATNSAKSGEVGITKHDILASLKKEMAAFRAVADEEHIGEVAEIADGIARIMGLGSVKAGEMLLFPGDTHGVALNLEDGVIGAMVLGDYSHIKEGDEVKSLSKLLSIGVGDAVLGRVLNPLGEPIDGKGPLKKTKDYLIERAAPGVIDREPVGVSLSTGIKAIDAMIPIGQGQRQLIIGDRQSGKTAIAIDTILNQKGTGVKCIYVAIGQKESKVARIVARLEEAGAMEYTTVVVAGASDNASLAYLAPYAGCAIGEYFMDKGEHALVVYDDLSKHAWAYRQIALLLRRPPGREAYPGDIFYLHSRLLERAARMSKEKGGGSLTALPVIETQAGDVSAYIPTNVISITDGQIYLDTDLFYRGIRPAINVGLSVSRVGGAAQIKAMKKVAGRLRLDLAQFRELEAFSQFASELDQKTREQIERGRRLVELLKQPQYSPLDVAEQVVVIYAGANGYLDDVAVDAIREWEGKFLQYLKTARKDVVDKVRAVGELNKETEPLIKEVIEEFKKR